MAEALEIAKLVASGTGAGKHFERVAWKVVNEEEPVEKVASKVGEESVAEKVAERIPEKIAEKRRVLGRGLDTLLPAGPRNDAGMVGLPQPIRKPGQEVLQLKLDQIEPNPYQTRSHTDEDYLRQLAESITTHGVMQPVTVRPAKDGKYMLIAGECRWKASAIAKKETIPAIVRVVSDQQALELTIIENLQREDLNCLDQARAFQRLSDEFQLKQEEIALRTGLNRSTVGNYLRLMRLPPQVQLRLSEGSLVFGQAKVLMGLEDDEVMVRVAEKAAKEETSVRELESIVFNLNVPVVGERKPGQKRYVDPNVRQAQIQLERALGVRVKIRDTKGRGSILLQYRNLEDFDRVVGALMGQGS